ncbi:DUF2218 domain-containing protein [Halovulum sp. GXIMD14794]
MDLTTSIATSNGSRYLQQLCKHFAHKIETSFTPEQGVCRFDFCEARMTADGVGLTITVVGDSVEGVDRGKAVIWSHLERFAFREDLPEPVWTAA